MDDKRKTELLESMLLPDGNPMEFIEKHKDELSKEDWYQVYSSLLESVIYNLKNKEIALVKHCTAEKLMLDYDFRGTYGEDKSKFKKEYTIPEGKSYIPKNYFRGCDFIEKVVIPHSVNLIDNDAFIGCAENVIIKCSSDSYAAKYARENNMHVEYTDKLYNNSTFIKTNKDVTINNTIGELHQYYYGSWVWIPELEMKADTKFEIYETTDNSNMCFITEYEDGHKAKSTYRVGANIDDVLRAISSYETIDIYNSLESNYISDAFKSGVIGDNYPIVICVNTYEHYAYCAPAEDPDTPEFYYNKVLENCKSYGVKPCFDIKEYNKIASELADKMTYRECLEQAEGGELDDSFAYGYSLVELDEEDSIKR